MCSLMARPQGLWKLMILQPLVHKIILEVLKFLIIMGLRMNENKPPPTFTVSKKAREEQILINVISVRFFSIISQAKPLDIPPQAFL